MCDSKKGRYCPGREPKGVARRRRVLTSAAQNPAGVITTGDPGNTMHVLTQAWTTGRDNYNPDMVSGPMRERDHDETVRFLTRHNQGLPEPDQIPVPDDPAEQAGWAHTSRTLDELTGDRPMTEPTRQATINVLYGNAARTDVSVDPPPDVRRTISTLHRAGARPYLVGGCVRDAAAGQKDVKDWDIEVYGQDASTVARALRHEGRVNEVGKSFGVLAVTTKEGTDLDVSLPRTDSKTDQSGHRGFDVSVDPHLSTRAASERRDFTPNALMYDPRLDVVVDHHGGLDDMRSGTLKHVGDAFDEDPLRVLRGGQLASRMGLTGHPDTLKKCRSLAGFWSDLSTERVWGEWDKLTRKGTEPGRGLRFIHDAGWDGHAPGLPDMNTPPAQAAANTASDQARQAGLAPARRQEVTLAAITSRAGPTGSARFMSGIGAPKETQARVGKLVTEYPTPPAPSGDPEVRALARRLHPATIQEWAIVRSSTGHDPTPWTSTAERVGVLHHKDEPLLQGRHVLARYGKPRDGRKVGDLLTRAASAQENGEFTTPEGAEDWLRANAPDPADWNPTSRTTQEATR